MFIMLSISNICLLEWLKKVERMNNFGKKLLEYQMVIKLAKEIKSLNPEKDLITCRQEAYDQLKAE
jgi:hypothetical protein